MLENSNQILKAIKYFKPVSVKKISSTPIISRQINIIDRERLKKENCGELILKFVDYVTKSFKDDDLTNFYNNVNSFKVCFDDAPFETGGYTPITNMVNIYIKIENGMNGIDTTLPHELFHMASAYYDKKTNTCYCGFGQNTNKLSIGLGLTEGYTQLLTNRYIDENIGNSNDIGYFYVYETFIMSKLEDIIGKEKMEELYFKANLLGLIKELEKYADIREIISFIRKLDQLCNLSYIKNSCKIKAILLEEKLVDDEINFMKTLKKEKMK